jgi:hypothetical protein
MELTRGPLYYVLAVFSLLSVASAQTFLEAISQYPQLANFTTLMNDNPGLAGALLTSSVPAPDLVTVKDFLRFYIATSHPQIDNYRPTADAICTVGEWFFAGFTRATGTDTRADDRSEVYYVRCGCFLALPGPGS